MISCGIENNALTSRQCTCSHFGGFHGQTSRTGVWYDWPPNLAPSDYFLFSKFKVLLGGQIVINEDVIANFAEPDANYIISMS